MTIKSLELFNFESHKESILDFTDGVNIITGLSGHGKSGIVRGFRWVIHNSPNGEAMLSYSSNGTCSSGIVFDDDNGICRSRDSKINEYFLDKTDETFKALRGKIPDGVSLLSNMDETNIQRQKDFYFMLTDSPGQVAKMWNKVSGLEEMDSALSTINSMYRERKKTFDALFSNKESIEGTLADIEYITKADSDFTKIESCTEKIEEYENEIGRIDDLLSDISSAQKEIDSCMDVSAIPRIDAIFSKEEECNEIEQEIDDLEKLIESCSQLKNQINNIKVPDRSRLVSLEAIRDSCDDIRDEITSTNLLIQHIAIYKADIKDAEVEIELVKSSYDKTLKDNKVCPTCMREM